MLTPELGYKFETLSLLPTPWDGTSRDYIESREDAIVNNHAQYCSVVKTGIGKTKMILGGEVDAGTIHYLTSRSRKSLIGPQFGTVSPKTRISLSIGLSSKRQL